MMSMSHDVVILTLYCIILQVSFDLPRLSMLLNAAPTSSVLQMLGHIQHSQNYNRDNNYNTHNHDDPACHVHFCAPNSTQIYTDMTTMISNILRRSHDM